MSRKKKAVVLVVCLILCLAVGTTFAWYLREDAKRAETKEAKVMAPYNLYLLDPNDTDSLRFAVGNLHPGETKQTVICVSNERPKDMDPDDMDMAALAKESEFGYDLMLVHTENLAVDYNIYPAEKHDRAGHTLSKDDIVVEGINDYYWTKKAGAAKLDGSDISEDMRRRVFGEADIDSVVNKGTYWLSDDDTMQLAYKNNTYEYDYYLIEVKWKDIANFDDYKKETDLVYVVVNAKQPRPVEK